MQVLGAGLLIVLALVATGCQSVYSHANRPLQGNKVWPDCRATTEIEHPRGQEDVLVILCLSGGGSRASWFSAATMLRLERVVDEINLLHEVDVISSVSGGSLPAAYYCATRDPGPYSVVRVETLPAQLPPELEKVMKMDRQRGLLGFWGKMSAGQRDDLLPLFASRQDQASVEQLYWLSNHTRAPAVWQAEVVRDLMTRNYIQWLFWDSLSPMNNIRYWLTSYDRSDMMAQVFNRNLYSTKLVQVPRPLRQVAELEFLGWLDRPPAPDDPASEKPGDELRWPRVHPVQAPVRLDWIPGYSPAREGAQFVASNVVGSVHRVTRNFGRVLPYRFKDLNPERPYLILNTTNGNEDEPGEPRFGEVFPFTREEFAQHLASNIDDYPLAWGVMASAAFPAVFSYVTLRDFRATADADPPRYMHVFDGGNADNLGLISAKRIILQNRDRYRHFVVLLVDSRVSEFGADRSTPDARNPMVDMNFMSSFGCLLESVRRHEVAEFQSGVLDGQNLANSLTFWQIAFDDVRDEELRTKANKIPTTFLISRKDAAVVEQCVQDLVRKDHPKMQEFLRVLRVAAKPGQPAITEKPSASLPSNVQTPVPRTQ